MKLNLPLICWIMATAVPVAHCYAQAPAVKNTPDLPSNVIVFSPQGPNVITSKTSLVSMGESSSEKRDDVQIARQAVPAVGVSARGGASLRGAEVQDSPRNIEALPQLNFVVDVLAGLTAILALIGGFTLFTSRREADAARRESQKTLIEAREALEAARKATADANLHLASCTDISVKLREAQSEMLKDFAKRKAEIQELISRETTEIESEIAKAKIQVEAGIKEEREVFGGKLSAELELFRRQLHEATAISRTKTKLLELLASKTPDPDEVFPLITDILNYPDQRSFEIYERLLEIFSSDEEIISKVKDGIRIYRERSYGDLTSRSLR